MPLSTGLFEAAPDGHGVWRRGLANGPPAIVHPFVPQGTSEVLFHCMRDVFVAPSAATDAANPVQCVIAAEACVASEDGHERRWWTVLCPWRWASNTSGH